MKESAPGGNIVAVTVGIAEPMKALISALNSLSCDIGSRGEEL